MQAEKPPRNSSSRSSVAWSILVSLLSLLIKPDLGLLCPCNFTLQLEETIQKGFGCGWAARYVDIYRDYPVTTPHHRIRIMVVSSTICTASHRYDPSRFRHLIVYFTQRWSHFVGERAGNNHAIRLARTWTEDDTESIQIITCSTCVHHFNCTAC